MKIKSNNREIGSNIEGVQEFIENKLSLECEIINSYSLGIVNIEIMNNENYLEYLQDLGEELIDIFRECENIIDGDFNINDKGYALTLEIWFKDF